MNDPRCPRCGASPADPGARICSTCADAVYVDRTAIDRTDPWIGRLLDRRFALMRRIAVGGMGALYEAVQLPIERPVAVKVIRPDLLGAGAEVIRARFRREARALSRLKHPHAVTLFDFGETPEGDLYMAMELIEGPNLEVALKAGPLPPDRAIAIVAQAAQALDQAHRLGVVHRDLKPANLMLADLGDGLPRVKVVDFGIARLLDGPAADQRFTLTGKMSGTPHYMSPEVARGGAADHRSDLYALGLILYRAIAGRPPFDGSAIQVVLQQMNDTPPPLSAVVPDVELPEGLQALLDRALRKRPEERHASAGELLADLEGLQRRDELGALWAESGAADELFAVLRAHGERLNDLLVAEIQAQVPVYRLVPAALLRTRVRFYFEWCLTPFPDEGELARYLDRRWARGEVFARLPDVVAAFSSWFPALRGLVRELSPDARLLVERHMATLDRHVWLALRVVCARHEALNHDGGAAAPDGGALRPEVLAVTVLAARCTIGGEPQGDPEAQLASVRRVHEALRRSVLRRGGRVESADVTGMIAVFGTPVAHDDDAEAAVRAAIDCIADLERESSPSGAPVGFGVATGAAVSGDIGTDDEPHRGIVGDAVSHAVALRDRARPGEVVIDAATRSRLDFVASHPALRSPPAGGAEAG